MPRPLLGHHAHAGGGPDERDSADDLQTGTTATQTASQRNTTAQRLVQVQIGCVAFCDATTQTQTAVQMDATSQTIGQTQAGTTVSAQQATQGSQTRQSVKQIQINCITRART